MFGCPSDEGIGGPINKLLCIPEVERAVFEGTGNDTLGVSFDRGSPGNVVESGSTLSAEDITDRVVDLVLIYLESAAILAMG
jgi:hypothetical protein